jgi:hypothetical protein
MQNRGAGPYEDPRQSRWEPGCVRRLAGSARQFLPARPGAQIDRPLGQTCELTSGERHVHESRALIKIRQGSATGWRAGCFSVSHWMSS